MSRTSPHLAWISVCGLYTLLGPLAGAGLLAVFGADLPGHFPAAWSAAAITLLAALAVAIALLPSVLFAACVGFFAPNLTTGFLLAAAGIFGATWVGLGLSRRFSAGFAESLLSYRQAWLAEFTRLRSEQGHKLLGLVFLARLSPHMPFAATNVLVAQLQLNLWPATLASWLGLLPRSLLATSIGYSLTAFDQFRGADLGMWGIAATLCLILMLGWLVRRKIRAQVLSG